MKNKFLVYLFLTTLMIPACTDDFQEINTPPTTPSEVPGDFLFTRAQYFTQREQGHPWLQPILRWGAWVQHYGNGNQGFTTPHYVDILSYNDDFWNSCYDYIIDIRKAKELYEKQEVPAVAAQKIAIAELLEITNWIRLTDNVGDIPYSEALQGGNNLKPKYDSQQEVYNDLIARTQAAIAALKASDPSYLGGADTYFKGNPAQWIKYGNGLLLRMGLRLSKVDPAKAQATVSGAMGGSLPSSNADNAVLPTTGGGIRPNKTFLVELWERSPADRPFAGEALVNILKGLEDPRLPILIGPTPASVAAGGPLEYRGVPPAMTPQQYAEVNANIPNYSRHNDTWFVSETLNRGTSAMTYAEISFAKAEAALRGWGASEAQAQTFFQEGIRAAMTNRPYSDAGITEAQINGYLSKHGTLTGTFAQKLEQIHVQKWITYVIDQEDEAFAEWRRTGYPQLDPGDFPGDTGGTIPRRFTYSNGERILNPDNWQAASSKLSSGDSYVSRVWWDK